MREPKGFIKVSYNIGQVIIQGIVYQSLFLLYTLRGLVIFGLFPSLAAVFQGLYNQIRMGKSFKKEAFKSYYKEYFKISNQLGYTFAGVIAFLWVDLRISATFIHSIIIHFILLLFFIIALGMSLYVFPSLCRYELTYKQYIQRAFILFASNIIGTFAMLIGFFVGTFLGTLFPILLVIATIPLFVFPIIWFSIQGMEKTEKRAEKL